MKSLKQYVEDFLATPANTIGMGDMAMPSEEPLVLGSTTSCDIGSGDMPRGGIRLKRKKKHMIKK